MRDALAIGGAAVVLYFLFRPRRPPRNPNTVNPRTAMTVGGQDATVYAGGIGTADGVYRGRPYDSAAAKAAAKAFAAKPTTSKLSLFRAISAQNARTPPAPAPVPDAALAHYVRGTMAVTQIT